MNGRGLPLGRPPAPGWPLTTEPQCAVPSYDTLDPLTKLFSPNQRGKECVLVPPPPNLRPDAEGRVFGPIIDVLETMTGIDCVVGELICVTLGKRIRGPIDDALTNLAVTVQLRAIISYGLGSANFRVECDWLHGTDLAINMDRVGIKAQYVLQTDPGLDLGGYVPPSFDLAGGIARWSVSRNSNGGRLTEIRYLAGGQGKNIPIPPGAISMNVQPLAAAGSVTARVRALGLPYSTTYTVTAPLAGYQVENALPLVEGAEVVEITNNDAQVPIRVAVVFGLAL